MRYRRGHAGILERAGRVVAEMFDLKALKSAIFSGSSCIVQRRVAFEEADYRHVTVEWQQLAIAPDAAAVARVGRSGALRPLLAEDMRIAARLNATLDFERASAPWTYIDSFAYSVRGIAFWNDASLNGVCGTHLRCVFAHVAATPCGAGLVLARSELPDQIPGVPLRAQPSCPCVQPQTKCSIRTNLARWR